MKKEKTQGVMSCHDCDSKDIAFYPGYLIKNKALTFIPLCIHCRGMYGNRALPPNNNYSLHIP